MKKKTENVTTCENMFSMGKENGVINHDATIITKDEKIKFRCTKCGVCCVESNISVSPFDMYNMAKSLNITCFDFFKEYCTFYLSESTGIPIVVLNDAQNGPCKFLKADVSNYQFECSLAEDARPMICRLNPFGVITRKNVKGSTNEKMYILNNTCGAADTETSVAEYCKSYFIHVKEHEAAQDVYFFPCFVMDINKYLSALEKAADNGDENSIEMRNVFPLYIMQLLFNFDTSKDFMEQINKCKKNTVFFLVSLCSAYYVTNGENDACDFLKDLTQPVASIFGSNDAFLQEYTGYSKMSDILQNNLFNDLGGKVLDYIRTKLK